MRFSDIKPHDNFCVVLYKKLRRTSVYMQHIAKINGQNYYGILEKRQLRLLKMA